MGKVSIKKSSFKSLNSIGMKQTQRKRDKDMKKLSNEHEHGINFLGVNEDGYAMYEDNHVACSQEERIRMERAEKGSLYKSEPIGIMGVDTEKID